MHRFDHADARVCAGVGRQGRRPGGGAMAGMDECMKQGTDTDRLDGAATGASNAGPPAGAVTARTEGDAGTPTVAAAVLGIQGQAASEEAERPRVLVIDDERFNLNTLHGLLKDSYRVMVATDGVKGLQAALSGRPDLVLLDVDMPDMDGHEVCRRLKSDPMTRGIPVIFISALADAADETLGLELGAADYITKPFHPAVVRARVRTQMRLKQQSDLLERYAFLDGLTGLANRRAFDERSAREWERARRTGRPLSVIMGDVDHFKPFNDHAGHAAGDACLRAVAGVLQHEVRRASDLVARYGGEEFVVLLPDTEHAGALAVGHALRAAVARAALPHPASPVAPFVTLSVGVASVTARPMGDFDTLLRTADSALYDSKRQGRDKVYGIDLDAAQP